MSTEYAQGSNLEAVRLLPSKSEESNEPVNIVEQSVEVKDAEIVEVESPVQEAKDAKKLLAPFKFVGKTLKKAVDDGVKTFNKVSDDINAASKSKDIEDQQYTCLVLLFYLNHLGTFLGLNEDQ